MAQIDEVILPAEREAWLANPAYMMGGGEPSYSSEKRVILQKQSLKYFKFLKKKSSSPIIEFLQHYIPTCLPLFMATEKNYWAFSVFTTYGPILAVNSSQTLIDIEEFEDGLLFRWYLTRSELHNAFGESLKRLERDYPAVEHQAIRTKAGGLDQVWLLIPSVEDAIRLCHDKKFIKQVRAFNFRVLHASGPRGYDYHSFPLMDEIVKRLSNYSDLISLVEIGQDSIDEQPSITGFEGRGFLRTITDRERDPLLVSKAKEKFKQEHGRLFCEICESDFSTVYGELGQACIEVHHLNPIAKRDAAGESTSINDLLLVCANCHTIIHHQNPILTVEALRQLVNQNRR